MFFNTRPCIGCLAGCLSWRFENILERCVNRRQPSYQMKKEGREWTGHSLAQSIRGWICHRPTRRSKLYLKAGSTHFCLKSLVDVTCLICCSKNGKTHWLVKKSMEDFNYIVNNPLFVYLISWKLIQCVFASSDAGKGEHLSSCGWHFLRTT